MDTPVLECIELAPADGPPAAVVIWLHGLGADGHDFEPLARELGLPGAVRYIFPHAPRRPVTVNAGHVMRAWYDVLSLDLPQREDVTGIRESAAAIARLVDRERERGLAGERIVLGGFSQGGALALYAGLRYPVALGGIVSLSAYLPLAPALAQEASAANAGVPVFMGHGEDDEVVSVRHGARTRDLLEDLSHPVEWRCYPIPHSVSAPELGDLRRWLGERLGAA